MSPIIREVTIGNCRADGCDRQAYCKGYCERHYRRFKTYGDPLAGKVEKGNPLAFLKAIPDTDLCVEWPFHVNAGGYGQLRYKGKMMPAHRLALIIHKGEPPFPYLHAAHEPTICHNRRCVNPKHIRWATPQSNMRDRAIDGTQVKPKGELHGGAKLTARDVEIIRAATGFVPQKFLADDFGVSKQTISRIQRNERWKHVKTI